MRFGLSVLFFALVIDLIVVECAHEPGIAARTRGVKEAGRRGKLLGKVMRGPLRPEERKDTLFPSKPASGVTLVILTAAGRKVKSVVTDSRGRYRISLPIGTYRVEIAPLAGAGWTKDLPANIAIVEGKEKRMDIFIETGNRKTQPLSGMGVLVGRVTMGPLSPVERSGASRASAPVPGAKIVISGSEGKEIKSVVTDDEGGYSVSLPPGTYRVEMAPLTGSRWTKDLPATATITEGQETRLDIRIDTGIR